MSSSEYNREYRLKNREKILVRERLWYHDNVAKKQEYRKGYYSKNRDVLLQKHKENRINFPEKNLLKVAKSRAKRLGLEFDITLEDIIIPTHCPILNEPLKGGSGEYFPFTPSLDRIDNTKGYVKENIRVISYRANSLKRNMTREHFQRFIDYIDGKI